MTDMPSDLGSLICNYMRNDRNAINRFLGVAEQCGYELTRTPPQPDQPSDESRARVDSLFLKPSHRSCSKEAIDSLYVIFYVFNEHCLAMDIEPPEDEDLAILVQAKQSVVEALISPKPAADQERLADYDRLAESLGLTVEDALRRVARIEREVARGEKPAAAVDTQQILDEFVNHNDSDNYPFDGEEYDLNLAKFVIDYLNAQGWLVQPRGDA